MTTVLRPYQLQAVTLIRIHAASGGLGAILQMPTGAGKTACFSDVLGGAYRKGKSGLMVVRGKNLVHQASERLTREGIPHGIYQGGNTRAQNELILLCSIDTLYKRQIAPKADIIVIDECFPAGTLVDGVPIEELKPGQQVNTFNHETGQVELRKITATRQKSATKLAIVYTTDGEQIVCTPNHPFATADGYKSAAELLPGDRLARRLL